MKVYEDQAPLLHQTAKRVDKKVNRENDFQKIMDEKMAGVEKGGVPNVQPSGDPVVGGVQILRGIEQIRRPSEAVGNQPVLDEIQKTLDLIDFYGEKLGDPSLSSKGLDPLVGHLEERLGSLRKMASNPEMPDKLRPILSDVVLTMGTEIAKFKRGDYV